MYNIKELPGHKYPSMSHLKYICQFCEGTGYVAKNHACFNCMQWGYVDSECKHEFIYQANVGKCMNEYLCLKCGKCRVIDSSD